MSIADNTVADPHRVVSGMHPHWLVSGLEGEEGREEVLYCFSRLGWGSPPGNYRWRNPRPSWKTCWLVNQVGASAMVGPPLGPLDSLRERLV
jgi:hypothetical protein